MNLTYALTGTFIEACNCRVICPCWVDDEPDEDFCAGLFAWTFAAGSTIEGHDVTSETVVSVTVHGDSRRGGESTSAIYVSDTVPADVADLLIRAFSGSAGGPLADLAGVTGQVVDSGRAIIGVEQADSDWLISVGLPDGAHLVRAHGQAKRFDGNAEPLRLQHTALSAELGEPSGPVTASSTDELQIDVAALPGGSIDVLARSGMWGTFRYRTRRPARRTRHDDD